MMEHASRMEEMLAEKDKEIRNLLDELEIERMRLATCGVIALANTPESAARARDILPEYRSASCDDVERMVDEQMALRAEVERLRSAMQEASSDAVKLLHALAHAAEKSPEYQDAYEVAENLKRVLLEALKETE